MNEELTNAENLTPEEKDKEWVREIWARAGEAWAKKLSEETGRSYTVSDALELIANDTSRLIDMYESTQNIDGTIKTEAEIEDGKTMADFLRGRRYHEASELAVSPLNERIGDMNQESHEKISSQEQLRAKFVENQNRIFQRLQELLLQRDRGADVKVELAGTIALLHQAVDSSVTEAEVSNIKTEYGGMDKIRFDTDGVEPAYLRAQRVGK